MIDEKILDSVIPVPSADEVKAELIEDFKNENLTIDYFQSGGVFNTLLMLVIDVYRKSLLYARDMIQNCFIHHATNDDMIMTKAADFGKLRKSAVKTRGYITLTREETGAAIRIIKNQLFKTEADTNGIEYRYLAVEDTMMKATDLSVSVLVEAEQAGAAYNVGPGKITKSLTLIDVDSITNATDWITVYGADIETISSLQRRAQNCWAELAPVATADKYINACEDIAGVLSVIVDDEHPRGQGTVDIYVIGTSGTVTTTLLANVQTVADSLKAPDDNVLVMAAATQSVNVTVKLQIPFNLNSDGMTDKAEAIISELFMMTENRNFSKLYISDLIYALKAGMPQITNVVVTAPSSDVTGTNNAVLKAGEITVTVERLSS